MSIMQGFIVLSILGLFIYGFVFEKKDNKIQKKGR